MIPELRVVVICPYCEKPMEEGVLYVEGDSFYLPLGEKPPPFSLKRLIRKRRGILFEPKGLSIKPSHPETFVCRHCKMLVIPYKDHETNKN